MSPGTFSVHVPREEVEGLQHTWASQHQGFLLFVLEFAVQRLHTRVAQKIISVRFKDDRL